MHIDYADRSVSLAVRERRRAVRRRVRRAARASAARRAPRAAAPGRARRPRAARPDARRLRPLAGTLSSPSIALVLLLVACFCSVPIRALRERRSQRWVTVAV